MNKKIIIILIAVILIVLIGVVVYYFGIRKEEKIDKTKLLEEIKNVIGMDLTLMNQVIKWNTIKGELFLDGQGYYYFDLLKSPKLMKIFGDLNKFFNENEFEKDFLNKEINSDDKNLISYKKSNIVCKLSRIDNSDDDSSLTVSCADINDTMCNFDSDCGRECKADSDCQKRFDSCQKKNVCVNKNYKFFSECSDPSNLIKDIDVTVQQCQCKNKWCEPYFPYLEETITPTPVPTPTPTS